MSNKHWKQEPVTRGQWAAGIVIGVIIAILVVWVVALDSSRSDDELDRATAVQTLQGCQRGNEIRRALAEIEAEFARECPLCRTAILDLDEDAKTEDNCRATVIKITGVDLGPMSGGPPPNKHNYAGNS